ALMRRQEHQLIPRSPAPAGALRRSTVYGAPPAPRHAARRSGMDGARPRRAGRLPVRNLDLALVALPGPSGAAEADAGGERRQEAERRPGAAEPLRPGRGEPRFQVPPEPPPPQAPA